MVIIEKGVRRLVARITARRFTNVHPEVYCVGENCVFHWPSWHVMLGWPKILRDGPFDLICGLIERRCPHGVGHPDPDSVTFFDKVRPNAQASVHGCDGCCSMSKRESVMYTLNRWAHRG